MSDADLRTAVRDSGLFVAEIANGSRWRPEDPGDEEAMGLHIVSLLDAEGLNCTPIDPPFATVDETVAAFGAICDRAARHGVRCHIEFRPWVDPRTLRDAWEIVHRADRPNGGVMFDSWHFHRSNGSLDDLRAVDPEKVFAVQLADAPAVPEIADVRAESRHRLLPGEGAAGLVDIVRVLDEIGVGVPFGGEAISPVWADLPASAGAVALHAAMVRLLTRARGEPPNVSA